MGKKHAISELLPLRTAYFENSLSSKTSIDNKKEVPKGRAENLESNGLRFCQGFRPH